MNTIRIEFGNSGQALLIHRLIKKVYDEYVSLDYSHEGCDFIYEWVEPS
jgi:hypothetical protein